MEVKFYITPFAEKPIIFQQPYSPLPVAQLIDSIDITFPCSITAVIQVNKEVIPRKEWFSYIPSPTDLLEVHIAPQHSSGGKDILRTVMTIAVIAAASTFGPAAGMGMANFAAGTGGLAIPMGAGAELTLGGILGSITTMGLAYGGLALIDAIAPLPTQNSNLAKSSSADSRSYYNVGAAPNKRDPWGAIPVLLGTHRFSPPYAAAPYTYNDGDKQYVCMLFCLGYSPIEVLQIKLGEFILYDVEDSVGMSYLVDNSTFGTEDIDRAVTLYEDYDHTTDNTRYFEEVVREESLNIELTYDDGWISQFTKANTSSVIIDITFPNGLYEVDDSGDYSNTSVDIDVRYREYGSSTWYYASTTTSTSEVSFPYLYDREVSFASLSILPYYYKHKVTLFGIYKSSGAPYMRILYYLSLNSTRTVNSANFPSSVYPVAYILRTFTPTFSDDYNIVYADEPTDISNSDIHDMRTSTSPPRDNTTDFLVHMEDDSTVPAELFFGYVVRMQDKETHNYSGYYTNPDDIAGLVDDIEADFNDDASDMWYVEIKLGPTSYDLITLDPGTLQSTATFTAASPNKIVQSYTCMLPSPAKYEIQVCRTTHDHDTIKDKIQDSVYWTSLRSIDSTKKSINMSGITLMEVRIQATDEFNGSLDTIVVTGYSPFPTAYNYWTDSPTQTSNPIDMYYQVLTHSANRKAIDLSNVDFLGLNDIWEICDSLNLRFDTYLDSHTSLQDILTNICSNALASPAYIEGYYTVIQDYINNDIAQHFTPRNSWGFTFTRQFTELPHAYKCIYTRAGTTIPDTSVDSEWEVSDDTLIYTGNYNEATATIFEDLQLPGTIIYDQAILLGSFYANCIATRQITYNLYADVENLVCSRGSRVQVTHDILSSVVSFGRILTLSFTGETLDSLTVDTPCLVTEDSGITFALRVRTVSGSYLVYVSASEGSQTTFSVLSVTPPTESLDLEADLQGALFAFGPVGQESLSCIVKSITPGEDLTAQLTLVPYDSTIYPIPS